MKPFDLETDLIMLTRLGVAIACGLLLGIERRRRITHPAGLRTMGLVTSGSCTFMLVSLFAFEGRSDPGRIAAQVVTGVGFLGAGIMFLSRGRVRNLTTAASIWVAASVGLAAGAGLWVLAGAATLSATGLLLLLPVRHPDDDDGREAK